MHSPNQQEKGARRLRYLSVCSGIEAATVAWRPLGWHAHAFAEIEKFPSAVLAHHYPEVTNLGDITKFREWPDARFDVLVGGTPCQSFSVAGLRAGLADPRGNLALVYLAIADRYRPEWLVWENVPGVRSVNGGRDFGAFLGGLGKLGYGWAYRSLDAQYFGLAQRRERVFVVAHLGDWRRAAAVLFDGESLSGNPPPRREAGQRPAPTIASRPTGGGGLETDFDCDGGLISMALNAHGGSGRMDAESETFVTHALDSFSAGRATEDGTGRGCPLVTHALRADGFDASEDGTGRGTPLVFNQRGREGGAQAEVDADGLAAALRSGSGGSTRSMIAFSSKDHGADAGALSPTLRAMGHAGSHANAGGQVAVAFVHQAGGVQTTLGYDPTTTTTPTLPKSQTLAVAIQEVGKRTGKSTTDVRAGIGIAADGDPMFTLQAGAQHGVGTGSAVRRLTPRECERLQGFPEIHREVRIEVCEDENCANARSAGQASASSNPSRPAPVVAHVLIDLERQSLQLHSRGRSPWSANTAAAPSSSPLPMPVAAFVHLAVLMAECAVPPTSVGSAGSQASASSSIPRLTGSARVSVSGPEVAGLASDAGKFTDAANRCTKSTTSQVGADTPDSASTLRIFASCVVAAISTFIPEETRSGSFYAITVETVGGYTLVPYRGKPAADGPRYKALGNSMAVPVISWIGQRIALLSAPKHQEEAA